MDWNHKKIWTALAASLVAFTSFIHADASTQMRNLENRVSSLEQRKGSNGMINPPARPIVKDGVDLSAQVDVLIWQATESGLGYGIRNNNGTLYSNDGHILNPDFEWDWGFKLGVDYNLAHDGWDMLLQWTRFVTDNGTHNVSANTGGGIFPSFFNTIPGTTSGGSAAGLAFNSTTEHWKLRLNIIDLELGREFYVSKWLTLRPHAGLRNAWVQQKFNVNYNNGFIGNATGLNVKAQMTNNFWGLGLRGGLDGNWGLGGGWSIYSDLALAILLGHFHVNQSFLGTGIGPSATTKVDTHYNATRVTGDWAMGFRYHHLFACERYGFTMQLGWEQHMFFSQNQLMRLFGTAPISNTANSSGMFATNQGDLTTQGVTLSLGLSF